MSNETERVVLSRVADSQRYDFSEQALEDAGVERLTLEDLGSEAAVNAATKEFLARVKRLEVEHNQPFFKALRHVIDTYPLLFKLSRLEKTRGAHAVVVLEEK